MRLFRGVGVLRRERGQSSDLQRAPVLGIRLHRGAVHAALLEAVVTEAIVGVPPRARHLQPVLLQFHQAHARCSERLLVKNVCACMHQV